MATSGRDAKCATPPRRSQVSGPPTRYVAAAVRSEPPIAAVCEWRSDGVVAKPERDPYRPDERAGAELALCASMDGTRDAVGAVFDVDADGEVVPDDLDEIWTKSPA